MRQENCIDSSSSLCHSNEDTIKAAEFEANPALTEFWFALILPLLFKVTIRNDNCVAKLKKFD